jgi:hypothetical protein
LYLVHVKSQRQLITSRSRCPCSSDGHKQTTVWAKNLDKLRYSWRYAEKKKNNKKKNQTKNFQERYNVVKIEISDLHSKTLSLLSVPVSYPKARQVPRNTASSSSFSFNKEVLPSAAETLGLVRQHWSLLIEHLSTIELCKPRGT